MTGQEPARRSTFSDWVPDNRREGILLDKAAGLFKSTGETLMHVASARSVRYDYNGADVSAQVPSFSLRSSNFTALNPDGFCIC